MTQRLRRLEAKRNTGANGAHGSTNSAPRWVKVGGIVAIVLILLIVAHLLTGGGPGMHDIPGMPSTPAAD